MKRTLIVFLLVNLMLSACAPASAPTPTSAPSATPLPTTTATPTSTPTATPTATPTPIPTIQVGSLSVPDPRVTNPELFDLRNPDAPIPQFVNAMKMAGIEVTKEQVLEALKDPKNYQTLKDKDGNPFLVAVYNLDPSLFPEKYRDLAGLIPLIIAERGEKGWGWSRANPNHIDNLINIPELYITGKYDEVLELEPGEFSGLNIQWPFSWNIIRPTINNLNFTMVDYAFRVARESNLTKITNAVLIWGYYPALPDWLKNGNYSEEELRELISNHIRIVMTRYKNRVRTWIVLNEPYGGGLNNRSFWDEKFGRNDRNWIERSFEEAHQIDPAAELILNDFGIEFYSENPESKYQIIYNLCRELKENGVPIDGIGFQMHIYATDILSGRYDLDKLRRSIREFKALG